MTEPVAAVAPNPWVVQPSKKRIDLPENQSFLVAFKGVEDTEITWQGKTESKWRWLWEVRAGEHTGKPTDTLTDREVNPDTQAGRLIGGLLGRSLVEGEDVKAAIDACVGAGYIGVCQKGTKGGKPCIRSVSKPPAM